MFTQITNTRALSFPGRAAHALLVTGQTYVPSFTVLDLSSKSNMVEKRGSAPLESSGAKIMNIRGF